MSKELESWGDDVVIQFVDKYVPNAKDIRYSAWGIAYQGAFGPVFVPWSQVRSITPRETEKAFTEFKRKHIDAIKRILQ